MKYTTLDGAVLDLGALDVKERRVFQALKARFAKKPSWNDFANDWNRQVVALYDDRNVPRKEVIKKPLFRIGQDMEARLGVEQGAVLPTAEEDYRDELEKIIYDHFATRREFCRATGVREDLLSHVLAKRKHMSIVTLTSAMKRIGRKLSLTPIRGTKKKMKTAS